MSKPPFIAFANDEKDVETLKQFASAQGWDEEGIHQGDITSASTYLKSNPSPVLLLVEVPSAAAAPALLDSLAEVCDPDTKVIITGNINEYSFYCWLTDIGIFSYLLKPLSVAALDTTFKKSLQRADAGAKQEKTPGKIIAVMGTRGGVGVSSISTNLAGIIADITKKNTALIDLDAHEGSIALSLDIEPSRGFREALEKPERIDPLFIDRVMTKAGKHLSVLSSEESLQERVVPHETASDVLLAELRDRFAVTIIDVSRPLNHFSQRCLTQADQVILVTELTLLSLRDALRQTDLMREVLKIRPPILLANRVGMASKFETGIADFEKGVNAKVAYKVPFAPDIFMHISNDIGAVKHKGHAASKALYQLVQQLVPDAKEKVDPKAKPAKSGGFFSRDKKENKGN